MGLFRNKNLDATIESHRMRIASLEVGEKHQVERNGFNRELMCELECRLKNLEKQVEYLTRDNQRYQSLLKQLGQTFWENEAVSKANALNDQYVEKLHDINSEYQEEDEDDAED